MHACARMCTHVHACIVASVCVCTEFVFYGAVVEDPTAVCVLGLAHRTKHTSPASAVGVFRNMLRDPLLNMERQAQVHDRSPCEVGCLLVGVCVCVCAGMAVYRYDT